MKRQAHRYLKAGIDRSNIIHVKKNLTKGENNCVLIDMYRLFIYVSEGKPVALD